MVMLSGMHARNGEFKGGFNTRTVMYRDHRT